jgi:hypothetical protein
MEIAIDTLRGVLAEAEGQIKAAKADIEKRQAELEALAQAAADIQKAIGVLTSDQGV